MITLAKKGTLHARRLALARLPDEAIVSKLFKEIGPRFADRPGGYTRIIKRHERRLGDAGHTAFIELLKEGEKKVRTRAPAPGPHRAQRVHASRETGGRDTPLEGASRPGRSAGTARADPSGPARRDHSAPAR